MSDHDTQIRYGRLAVGLTDIETAFEKLVRMDFGERVVGLNRKALDATTPIRDLVKNGTHAFEVEFMSDSEEDGYRQRYDFYNKQTAVLEVSTAFTHGWHNNRFSPKIYHHPRLVWPAVEEFMRQARESRGEEALRAFEATLRTLLSSEFMKHYKLHVEERMDPEQRLSLFWFPHDYNGVVIRVELWLVTPTTVEEEDTAAKRHPLH